MTAICIYFQVHQPFRLRRDYSFFDIGQLHQYEDDELNRALVHRIAEKCYRPATTMFLDLIKKHQGEFKIAFSISGVALEQLQMYTPDVVDLFKRLVDTGCVEFLNETYYHSLSFLFSREEFRIQTRMHRELMKSMFGFEPKVFRNTELIYSNDLALEVKNMGLKGVLAEGVDYILGWRSPNYVYRASLCKDISILLKNYRLSDDIAFRFSERKWNEWPLTADKYTLWLKKASEAGAKVINLFMDYETIGEHQWKETGIFDFFYVLPEKILKAGMCFKTPYEVISTIKPVGEFDVPHIISWADVERDVSAWLGNDMQMCAAEFLYEIGKDILASNDKTLIDIWRRLQTSDHFYYMCTKWFADGDVHKYFNPYNNPYEAYIVYMNILSDLRERIKC